MPLIGRLEARGPDVVAATPELDFVLAVLVGGLLLVQALERAIVPLVQPPAALDRNPRHLHLRERELRGLDRARSSDSWTTPGRSRASFISRPASTASWTPRSLSGTSVQPVNRFSRF